MCENKNNKTNGETQECATNDVARIVFAKIGTRVAHNDGPKEDEVGKDGKGMFVTHAMKCVSLGFSRFAIAKAEKQGHSECIGGMGRDKTVLSATACVEHSDMLQRVAGTGTAEDIFEAEHRYPVGEKETECDAQQYNPPIARLASQSGEAKCQQDDDGP